MLGKTFAGIVTSLAALITIGGATFAANPDSYAAVSPAALFAEAAPEHNGGRGRGEKPTFINPEAFKEATAATLGLTVAELEAAHEEGIKLEELAEQQGVTMEEIKAAVDAEFAAQIAQAVADGEITQEQADKMLEHGFRPGKGKGKGHGNGPGKGEKPAFINPEAFKEATAATLGLTVAELEAAHEEGIKLEELAEQQGVTMEEIKAAVDAEFAAQIAQAVADGEITQEQADKMLEHGFRFGKGKGKGHGNGPGKGEKPTFINPEAFKEATAATLGLTVAELEAAHEEGVKLEELAEQQGVTMEEIKAAVDAEFAAQIAQAVADGEITQEQADKMLEHGFRFGKGKGKGHGNGRPGNGQFRGAPTDGNRVPSPAGPQQNG